MTKEELRKARIKYNARYYAKNSEKIINRVRSYYQKNRVEILAISQTKRDLLKESKKACSHC